jgi:hypothetical protein
MGPPWAKSIGLGQRPAKLPRTLGVGGSRKFARVSAASTRPYSQTLRTRWELRELVGVLLREGLEPLQNYRIARHYLLRHMPFDRLLKESLQPRRREDEQHPSRVRPRVRGLVDYPPRNHFEESTGAAIVRGPTCTLSSPAST